jgi:glucose-6-phosphate-specific signal transduction histidine kinase
MRERVSQPGGNLTMESNSGVTTAVATFLISIAATTSNEELAIV